MGRSVFDGVLTDPGGRLQRGESWAGAAARLLLKETGLELSQLLEIGARCVGNAYQKWSRADIQVYQVPDIPGGFQWRDPDDLVRDGKAPRLLQDESKATYESWCRAKNAKIDWERSAGEVYNLIRGCNPSPGAWTALNGETLQIFDCEPAAGSGRPGRICAVDDESFTINAGLGGIRVKRVRLGKGGKVKAAEFLAENPLEIGARLGT